MGGGDTEAHLCVARGTERRLMRRADQKPTVAWEWLDGDSAWLYCHGVDARTLDAQADHVVGRGEGRGDVLFGAAVADFKADVGAKLGVDQWCIPFDGVLDG